MSERTTRGAPTPQLYMKSSVSGAAAGLRAILMVVLDVNTDMSRRGKPLVAVGALEPVMLRVLGGPVEVAR